MQERPETPAIHVRDLVVGFGKRVIIDHLSLDVRRGEILGLVGASGGGKSVLMRSIIGLIPPRSRARVSSTDRCADVAVSCAMRSSVWSAA